jgi:aldose 1-epimerase
MASPGVEPSGAQLRIVRDDQVAFVTQMGATLREYRVAGRDVVDGFPPTEMCSGGRGQVLLPWPNRIARGSYELGGERHQLALTEPERGHAIHGLVRWVPWRVVHSAADEVAFGFELLPQPGYPFAVRLGVTYSLDAAGLKVSFSAENTGSGAAPFGAGSHPYLKPISATIDEAVLHVPARSYLELDDHLIPTGRRLPVAGSNLDFTTPRPIAKTVLDTCYTDFEARRVRLDDVELSWDAGFDFGQCFSGDTLSPSRRRRGLAVEPMTCPGDAFNSGTGLIVLEPGQGWTGSWRIGLAAGGPEAQPRQ